MPDLDTVKDNVTKVAAIVNVISPLTGQVIQLGLAGVKAVQAIRAMLGNVAKNPDGTPLTDEDFARHFGAAEASTAAVIAEADKNIAESQDRIGALEQGDGHPGD